MKVEMRCGDLVYIHDVFGIEMTANSGWRLTLYSGGYKYYSRAYTCHIIIETDI